MTLNAKIFWQVGIQARSLERPFSRQFLFFLIQKLPWIGTWWQNRPHYYNILKLWMFFPLGSSFSENCLFSFRSMVHSPNPRLLVVELHCYCYCCSDLPASLLQRGTSSEVVIEINILFKKSSPDCSVCERLYLSNIKLWANQFKGIENELDKWRLEAGEKAAWLCPKATKSAKQHIY